MMDDRERAAAVKELQAIARACEALGLQIAAESLRVENEIAAMEEQFG